MANTIGKFDYEITKMGENDQLPFDPIVILYLKSYGVKSPGGVPTLSPTLMTDSEIDMYIQELKRDLDVVGRNAKKALATAKKQTVLLLKMRQEK